MLRRKGGELAGEGEGGSAGDPFNRHIMYSEATELYE